MLGEYHFQKTALSRMGEFFLKNVNFYLDFFLVLSNVHWISVNLLLLLCIKAFIMIKNAVISICYVEYFPEAKGFKNSEFHRF